MKKITKAMAAAMAVCMTVSAMSTTAFAAGYSSLVNGNKTNSSSGGYNYTPGTGTTYSNSVVNVPNSEIKVVSDKMLEASINSGKAITITTDSSKINAKAMQVLRKQKEPVVFKNKEFTVSIDPKTITIAREINLGMKLDLFPEAGVISIDPVQKGDFGLEMTVTIPAASLKDFNLKGLRFYYVSSNGKRKELKEFTVNEDGSLSFTLSHASSYVFEEEAENVDASTGMNDSAILIG